MVRAFHTTQEILVTIKLAENGDQQDDQYQKVNTPDSTSTETPAILEISSGIKTIFTTRRMMLISNRPPQLIEETMFGPYIARPRTKRHGLIPKPTFRSYIRFSTS
jgi:hypothetical protein